MAWLNRQPKSYLPYGTVPWDIVENIESSEPHYTANVSDSTLVPPFKVGLSLGRRCQA